MLARAGDSSTAPVTSFARRHPGAIARPALLRRLDDAPGRVVAIEAPPGTGKRTLAAAWLRQSPVNRACIELHDGRGVDAVARWLLTHGDFGSRLLVVSETPVPRSITTRGGVLRAGDLAFTADEIGALLNANGLRVSPTFVTALLEVTDGWAAAVDIGLRHLASETGGGFDAMLTALRAYALRSVIAPLPDDLARSLERMALGRYADGDDARATRSLVERQLVLASPGRNTLRVHPYLAWALRTTNTADAPHAGPHRAHLARGTRRPRTVRHGRCRRRTGVRAPATGGAPSVPVDPS
jgi:hypothetical protein